MPDLRGDPRGQAVHKHGRVRSDEPLRLEGDCMYDQPVGYVYMWCGAARAVVS
jgi:hypothetical protein